MRSQNNEIESYQLNIIPNQSEDQPFNSKTDSKENINYQDPSVSVEPRNELEEAKFISTVKEVSSWVSESDIKNDESKVKFQNPLKFMSKINPNSQNNLLDKFMSGFKEKANL